MGKGESMRGAVIVLCGMFWCGGAVQAEDRLAIYKKANNDACLAMAVVSPDAPKDPALLKRYCSCVAQYYWDSVPDRDVRLLLTTGNAPEIGRNVLVRLHMAMLACRTKIGF